MCVSLVRSLACVLFLSSLVSLVSAQCDYSTSHSSLAIDSGTGGALHGAGGATLKDGFCISASENHLKCQGQGRAPKGRDCPLSNQLCCGNAYRNSRPLPKPTAAPGVCSFTNSGGAKVQVVRGFCVKDERKECDEFGMSGNIGQGANCPGATTCCELLKKPKVAAPAPADPAAAPAPAAPVRDARAEIRAEFEAMRKKRADAAAAAAAAAAAPAPAPVPNFPEGTYCPMPSYKAASFVELASGSGSDSEVLLETEAEGGDASAPKLNAAQRAYCEQQRQAWLRSRAAKGDVQAQQALKQAPKKASKAATGAAKKTAAKSNKSKSKSAAVKKSKSGAKKSGANKTAKKTAKAGKKTAAKKSGATKTAAKKTAKKAGAKKSAKKTAKKTSKKTAKKAAKKTAKKAAKKTAKKSAKKATKKQSAVKKAAAKGKAAQPSAKRAQCLSKCARLACTKKSPLSSSCKRVVDNCNGTCPSDGKAKAKRAAPKAKKAAPKKKAAARKTNKAPRKAAAKKNNKAKRKF